MIHKAELHVHLEGTMRPSMAQHLAKKNHLAFPTELLGENNTYRCDDFFAFLHAYHSVSTLLRCDEDYSLITYDYLARCARQDTLYVEIMCAPDLVKLNQVSQRELIAGMTDGINRARQDFGIEGRILVTIVRDFGVQQGLAMVEHTLENPHPYIVGLGIAGNEVDYPIKDFAHAFQLARENELQCTAHAGEASGPDSVRQAIEHLGVSRIGHGVRSIESPALIDDLLARGITLEVCPSSNIALGIYDSFAEHPLKKLFDNGVNICINSDDPAFFGTTLGDEYTIAREVFGFNDAQLQQLTLNALNASFLDDTMKTALRNRVINA